MNRDINGDHFLETAEQFGVSGEIKYYNTHDEIFMALAKGEVFAGVAPQHFGLRNAADYGVIPSSIVFSPFSLYFTTKEGLNSDLLSYIDPHLTLWKADQNSFYYDSLQRWLGKDNTRTLFLNRTMIFVVLIVLLLSLLLGFNVLYLRKAVKVISKELKNKNEQLLQSEKMSALGKLAGGVAHDFNNQLLAISGFVELIREKTQDPEIDEFSENILKSVDRSTDLTKNMLTYARKGIVIKDMLDINALLKGLADMFIRSIDKSIKISLELSEGLSMIKGDSNQLEHAFLNLLINSRDAMPHGGEVEIGTRIINFSKKSVIDSEETVTKGKYILISVRDNGVGMSNDLRERIFEPFFTTKGPQKGTGMGLASFLGT